MLFILFFYALFKAAPAHTFVFIIAADFNLRALYNYLSLFVDSGIYDSLFSAFADRFYLADAVSDFEKSARAFKQLCLKIGAQTKAQNGDVAKLGYILHLIDLRGG